MGKNKKLITYLCIVFSVMLLLFLMILVANREKSEFVFSEEYVLGMELPSLFSFTYYNEEEWTEVLGDITNGKLTYKGLDELLQLLGVKEYIEYEVKNKSKVVDRNSFHEVYMQIVDLLDVKKKVKTVDIVILSDVEKDGKWLTQRGYREALSCGAFFEKYDMYTAYFYGKKIIGVAKIAEDPVKLKNIFVHSVKNEKAQVLFEKEEIELNFEGLTEDINDTICDLEWQNKKITAIYKKEDTIQGKVLSYNEKEIEIQGYGILEHKGLKIYKTYGTVEQLDESKLIIGNLEADFVVANKIVCGIILKEPANIEIIRVLLLNEGNILYEDVILSANDTFHVTVNEETNVYEPNTPIKMSEFFNDEMKGHLKLETETENGRIYFMNGEMTKTSLDYRGTFEVRKHDTGFGVVNELPLEQYLFGVVPSEMPASYEKEALKVQAVCARSYACIQLLKGGYAEFGAHVDDSTSYQVYNKQPENELTNLAVQDTVGEVLKYNDDIAEAYYFSTSCGYTESIAVWNMQSVDSYGYLQSESLLEDGQVLDLTNEEVFAEYIQNKEVQAYDSDGVYFRWSANLKFFEFKDQISGMIMERMAANPGAKNVQLFQQSGEEVTNMEGFGNILTMDVQERSSGGSVNTLRFNYENGYVLVKNEYNIRKILGVAVSSMTDKNDKAIDSIPLLPSAYFTQVPVESGYVLYGGGYGHGIGMSQNGANGMAKAGYSYTDILLKFYSDIRIENIYNGEP